MDRTEALTRLAQARVGSLATIRPDGRPHLVPVVFAMDGLQVVTAVDHKPKTTPQLTRLANIRSDPRVSLLAHGYSEDWRKLWWVRVDGQGEVIAHGRQFESALEALSAKYEHYRDLLPRGPVTVVGIDQVGGWKAAGAD